MGAHWRRLGYASVDALAAEARSGIAGQVRLMALYIEKTGLIPALRRHDWKAFAHGYNGPAYSRNGYDTRIAAAYKRHAAGAISVGKAAPMLRRGSKGEAVADLQRRLARLGYLLRIDGDFGPATAAAVKRFQASRRLKPDGIAGPRTLAALEASAAHRTPPDLWGALKGWLAGLFRRA
jgi:hypothetical protein